MLAGLSLVDAAFGQEAPPIEWAPVIEVRGRASGLADGDDLAEIAQRARLGLEASRTALSARVSFQEVRSWEALASGTVTPQGFDPELAEAWGRVRGELSSNIEADATVGRQALAIEEGRIVGRDDFAMAGQFFDALRLHLALLPLDAEYVNARHFEGGTEDPLGLGVNVLRVGGRHEDPLTTWIVDGLQVVDARKTDATTATSGLYLRVDTGRWRSRAEAYVQASGAGEATLLAGSVGRVFGPNERWVVHLRFDSASGDARRGGGGTVAWQPVLGDTHTFFGLMERFHDPEDTDRRGLADAHVHVDARPAPQVRADLALHHFWRPVDGARLGEELDGQLAWSFSPFGRVEGGAAWFVGTDQQLYGYAELDVGF